MAVDLKLGVDFIERPTQILFTAEVLAVFTMIVFKSLN